MKAFHLICLCSVIIANVFGLPLDTQNNVQRQRLRNYPSSTLYSTQIIDYPGMYVGGELPLDQMIVVPVPVSQFHQQVPVSRLQLPVQQPISAPLPIASPTTTTTTTTETAPIVVEESEPEYEQDVQTFEQDFGAPVPTTTVRVQVPSQYRYGVRRNPNVAVRNQVSNNQRFGGQDIVQASTVRNVPITRETEEERSAREEQERLIREEQAKNAHYTFDTMIDDKINDHSIQRQETRDGLALKGMYSYSDGFFRRTVHYEADENGYRVVKEDVQPIGDGPQYNPNGTADVQTNSHNNNLSYSITAKDFVREKHNKSVTTTESP